MMTMVGLGSPWLAKPPKPQQHNLILPFASPNSLQSTLNCRPAVILPGLGNNTGDYDKLAFSLKEYGVPSVIAKVSRVDWLRNAAGLFDGNYWRGTFRPRPILDWYLERVENAISEAKLLSEGGSLSIIGHSAGGWLARVCLEEFGMSHVSLLLTLGTPHLPPPKGLSGVIDQTRGLLNYVEEYCSRAVYTPELKYVCIAGRYIQGACFYGNLNAGLDVVAPIDSDQHVSEAVVINSIDKSSITPSIRSRFIGQGYKQVCGRADVWGDGVVPEVSAHLEGALNISFEGVYHSPVGSDDQLRPWYGSPAVLAKWVHHLLN
ncbi:alpha/beta-Hydrolases superfamily protein [Tasmannia lanceolata]|uniref:alpha/beta-Hydrolases superfamily protein n=1 Tax=Tasmannia lanceolata TaxID=3420 RepID=UPI004063ED3E